MRKSKTNTDVRGYAAFHDVTLGEIAEKLGIAQGTFSTAYMRLEMTEDQKESVRKVIDEIVEERRNDLSRISEA